MPFVKERRFPFSLFSRTRENVDDLLTPFADAVAELERRSKNEKLRYAIDCYLNNDVPDHFRNDPILYLARHVATPNFETLRFLHLVEPTGFKPVIGQDVQDIFVSVNPLKKALGKLSISTGVSYKNGLYLERFEKKSIIDFNAFNGKQFREIQTAWGEDLPAFHEGLFSAVSSYPATIVDDSEWINRNGRGDLLAHYKRFLALFVTHGILFEDYQVDDKHERAFVRNVLRPAFKYVEKRFGCRPLITNLTPTSVESSQYWISYPLSIKEIIENRLAKADSDIPPGGGGE